MEGMAMQPEKDSDDIHTILSRFNSWSGMQNGNAVQVIDDEVREIPYEEAMRRVRNRVRGGNMATNGVGSAVAPVAEKQLPVGESVKPDGTAVRAVEALLQASMVAPPTVKKAAKKPEAKTASKAKPRNSAVAAASAKRTPARKRRAALKVPDAKPVDTEAEEFRQVLAKSVRRDRPATRFAKAKTTERKECVPVPLSSAEMLQLQQCAAMAGVTVAVYLRMRALGTEVPRRETETELFETNETRPLAAKSVPAEESHSGFGDWITLLRNRFLSSPARFAERA
jgi:hypothetical protein